MKQVIRHFDFVLCSSGYEGRLRYKPYDDARAQLKSELAAQNLVLACLQYTYCALYVEWADNGDEELVLGEEDWEDFDPGEKVEDQPCALLIGDKALREWSSAILDALRQQEAHWDTFALVRGSEGSAIENTKFAAILSAFSSAEYCMISGYDVEEWEINGLNFAVIQAWASSG